MAAVGGGERREREGRSQAVSLARRQRAGRQRELLERRSRHERERAVEVLQVIGVVDLLSVEQHQRLVAAPAAHLDLGGDVVGRRAGQQIERTEDVAGEVGQGGDLGA